MNFVLSAAKTQKLFVHHYKRGTRVAALKYQKGLGHLRTRPNSRVVGKSMLGVGFRGKILDLLLNPTSLQRNLDPFILPLLCSLKNTPIESLHHTASSLQCILPHFWCSSLSICSHPVYQIHIRSKFCRLFPSESECICSCLELSEDSDLFAIAWAWLALQLSECIRVLVDWLEEAKKQHWVAWVWLMW